MPSFVWDRDAEEAWAEPYEYEGQKQFVREAERLLPLLKEYYSKGNMHYHGFEESLEKAVWLLQVDSLHCP